MKEAVQIARGESSPSRTFTVESGPKARSVKPEQVLNIKRQCEEQRAAFFFKQWGGWGADGRKRAEKQNVFAKLKEKIPPPRLPLPKGEE